MIQVIKYKCCGKIFAACCEPYCYTDEDWLNSLKEYAERGDKIQMIESGKGITLERCDCDNVAKTQLELFSSLA